MNRLESRIERLEVQMGARTKPLVIRGISWADGDVIGFRIAPTSSTPAVEVMRNTGESEEALFKRASKGLTGVACLFEIREGDGKPYVHPYKLAEPVPEKPASPIPEAEPQKAKSESTPVAKPKFRVMEIKEVESQYADRRHWMMS